MARGFFAKHEVTDILANFLLMLAATSEFVFFGVDLATFLVPILITLGGLTVTKTPVVLASIVTRKLIEKLRPILDALMPYKNRTGLFLTLDTNKALTTGRFAVVKPRRVSLVKSLSSLLSRYVRFGTFGVRQLVRNDEGS